MADDISRLIQRFPAGLLNLLNMAASGRTPSHIDDTIFGTIDLLQFYGQTQVQTAQTNNAAVAEGVSVSVIPSATSWTLLFAAQVMIVKTATMTALRGSVSYQRSNVNLLQRLIEDQLGPFGATETGTCSLGWVAPYPFLLPPGSIITGSAPVIGTDATCDLTVRCEFGLLG